MSGAFLCNMTNEEVLKKNGGRHYDVCLMNPPYAKNMHLKFLEKCLEIVDTTISIQPIVWLNKSKVNTPLYKYRKLFDGHMKSIEYIPHRKMNDYFNIGNAIEAGAIFVVGEHGDVDLSTYDFSSPEEKNLFEKINLIDHSEVLTFNQATANIKYGKMNTKNNPIKLSDHKYYVPVYTWHGGKDCYEATVIENPKKKIGEIMIFNSEDEVNNFKESLKTQFMNWYYWSFVVPADYKLQNVMFRLKDYSKPVTNETFYKLFNIAKEEQEIIENFKPNNEQ